MLRKPLVAIFGISFLISLVIGTYLTYRQQTSELVAESVQPQKPQILGMSAYGGGGYRRTTPQMYVYGGENAFASGGVISMSSADEPALSISAYNLSGTAQVTLYRADIGHVLDYLVHDGENKQLHKSVETGDMELIGTTTHNIHSSDSANSSNVLPLPIEGRGIWYVNIQLDQLTVDGYIIRSDNGVIAKEGKDKFIFWGQNFETLASVTSGEIKVYDLKDDLTVLDSVNMGLEGMAQAAMSESADVAIYTAGDDIVLVPLNLQYLNIGSGYAQFAKSVTRNRAFIFTDRPLYQPGDTVKFKAIIRQDEDARYTIPQGTAKVVISTGNNESKFEKSYTVSDNGSIDGEYQLPEDAPVGNYNLMLDVGPKQTYSWGESASNYLYFNVQHYQKPESYISVDTPKIEYISGDVATLQISGSYFSGQPLIGTDIKYKVTAADYSEYSYYSDQERQLGESLDSFYGAWYGSTTVSEGTVTLGQTGEATVDIDTKQLETVEENTGYTKGRSKIFIVEITQDDGSMVPSYSKKNFLVYAGEYGIYREGAVSAGKVNQVYQLPLKLGRYFRETKLSAQSLTAKIHRETWVKDAEQLQKYPTYHLEEEDLGEQTLKTGEGGVTKLSFTPTKLGYYKIKIEGRDAQENYITKDFFVFITDRDIPRYTGQDAPSISLTLDQEKYEPTDTAILNITSDVADRDLLLTLERGRVDRTQIVHLDGKSQDVEIPLTPTDVPNIYFTISGFNQLSLDQAEIGAAVSAEGKKLTVTLTPGSTQYGPGDSVSVDIHTLDQDGSPVAAEVAVWAVDKAIFELADTNLFNIFDTFWTTRGDTSYESHSLLGIMTQQAEGGGGCFAPGTLIRLNNGATKPIENIHLGDQITTRSADNASQVTAEVTGLHHAQVSGLLVVNDSLRLTPDHILRVNAHWRTAGDLQIGDRLTGADGADVVVESLSWQLGKFDVYNLEIDKYHTFIADGIWVHNQKGDGRSNFTDTAYWNPVIKTNKKGEASIKFKLPDNLTTWTMAAVASTTDSRVGQSTKEIIVTKDVIVRPILPNILRVGDELYLSALVQNFTDTAHKFQVQLSFDSGDVEQNTWENVKIAAQSMERLDWKITPKQVSDNAKIKIIASATDGGNLSDSVEVQVPVRQFGFVETVGMTAIGSHEYDLKLDQAIDPLQSSVKLSLSPSLLGSLPTVMNYLVEYAYGCVEQTVSRLVPALLVAENPQLFGADFADKNLDKIIDKSLKRLATMQRGDGGWTWWYTGKSDPYITSYVVENIVKSQDLGHKLPSGMLERAQTYLKNNPLNLSSSDPDLVALSVIQNPSASNLKKLTAMAVAQGDSVYWEAGPKSRFGSIDASTGLALRALLAAKGDRELIDRAVLYLTRSRQSEYWGNTYATSRIVTALVEYAKVSSDLRPNFTYQLDMDGKKVVGGTINNSASSIEPVNLELNQVKKTGSVLTLSQTGEGNLYSTLLVSQFLTSTTQPSISRGISISKKFENAKGSDFEIGVGDTVNILLTISGLSSDDKYAVITDELPSGMVPVNTGLKNEASSWSYPEDYENGFNVTDTEVTENGVVLSLYNIPNGEHTYSYKARVVSAGKFNVPSAAVSLMYSPEIYGRSATAQIELSKTYGAGSGQLTNKLILPIKVISGAVAGLVVIISAILIIRKKRRQKTLSAISAQESPQQPNNET